MESVLIYSATLLMAVFIGSHFGGWAMAFWLFVAPWGHTSTQTADQIAKAINQLSTSCFIALCFFLFVVIFNINAQSWIQGLINLLKR